MKLVATFEMSKRFVLFVSLVANSLLVSFVFLHGQNKSMQCMYKASKSKNPLKLEFIPEHPTISCNDLFTDSLANEFKMSTKFDLMFKEFRSEVNVSVAGKTGPIAGYFDGHSFLLPEQYKALHYMASLEFVRTICETGFNYGHSSFNFLTANDKAVIHSFDLGFHHYTKHMASYLSAKFPGRFFIYYGDSTKSVPEFVEKNPDIRCDLIFVDGSHTYSVAKSDLENLIEIAGDDNVIVMDDYPTMAGRKYGQAWEELVAQRRIKETMRCKFKEIVYKHTSEAAFVVGSAVITSQ